MRVFPSKAVATTNAPKWASPPSTRASAPGIRCSMRFFRSAGSMVRLLDAAVKRHAAAETARGVELAVGVRGDLRRGARARKGAIRRREGADALVIQDVGPIPDAEDAETRVRLHAAGQLGG